MVGLSYVRMALEGPLKSQDRRRVRVTMRVFKQGRICATVWGARAQECSERTEEGDKRTAVLAFK